MKPTSPPSHTASAGVHHHDPVEMENDDVAHEHSDINISALVFAIVVMFGVVLGTAGLMALLFGVLEREAKARDPKLSPLAMPATTMPKTTTASPFFGGAPEPKLMTGESLRLNEVRTEQQGQLHGYGWMDEKAGVAHIPIDQAKKLTLERGLAVRPDPLTDDGLGTRRPAGGESSSGRNVTKAFAPAAAEPAPAPAAGAGGRSPRHSQVMTNYLSTATVCALALVASTAVYAQNPGGLVEPGDPTSARPGILSKIAIDQRIGSQVPSDIPFVDENGQPVKIGDYFGTRPVVLALVYYECPMLCTQVLNGLVSALGVLNFEAGREFDVVAVSFNPKEGPGLASQKKSSYVERYGRPQAAGGWHFLTGTQESIKRLTGAVGFKYEYDPKIEQFAHGAAIELLTPKGTIAKYYYGIEYSPRDLRLGIIEASDERIGTVIDDVLLFCYHYDPSSGKYGASVLGIVRAGGIATVLAFAVFLTVSLRRDHALQT